MNRYFRDLGTIIPGQYKSLLLLVGLIVVYVGWRVWLVTDLQPRIQGDSLGYFDISEGSFASIIWGSGRPPVMPLFIKIAQADVPTILYLQAILSASVWFFLSYAIAIRIEHKIVRIAAFGAILMFGIGQQITHWDSTILSESLSLSFLILFLGFAILAVRSATRSTLIGFSMGLVIWMLIRDSNSIIALVVAISSLPYLIFRFMYRDSSVAYPIVAIVVTLVGIYNVLAIVNAGRSDFAGAHLVVDRILPRENRSEWFQNRGMPVPNSVSDDIKEYEQLIAQGTPKDKALQSTLFGDEYSEFWQWVKTDGLQEYIVYFVTHPNFGLFAPFMETLDQPMLIGLNQGYASPDFRNRLPSILEMMLFPSCDLKSIGPGSGCISGRSIAISLLWLIPFGISVIGVAVIGLNRYHRLILVMLIIALIHGGLVWHGDSWEMDRHLFQLTLLLRLGILMIIAFGLDSILSDPRRRRFAWLPGLTRA